MKINSKTKARFQFVGSSIKSLTIKNNYINLDENPNNKRSFSVDYYIENVNKDDKTQEYLGIMTLNVSARISNELKKMSISLAIQGCFSMSGDGTEDEIKEYLSLNGCTTLYSIARSIVMSISSQAVVNGSVVLPMLNIFKLNEEKQKQIQGEKAIQPN